MDESSGTNNETHEIELNTCIYYTEVQFFILYSPTNVYYNINNMRCFGASFSNHKFMNSYVKNSHQIILIHITQLLNITTHEMEPERSKIKGIIGLYPITDK